MEGARRMPALTDLRDQACLVGIGETDYTRGTPKSALELVLEASLGATEDAGIQPGDTAAVRGKGRLEAPSLREVEARQEAGSTSRRPREETSR